VERNLAMGIWVGMPVENATMEGILKQSPTKGANGKQQNGKENANVVGCALNYWNIPKCYGRIDSELPKKHID
jgi:hypothetical protein